MTKENLTQFVKQTANELGFDFCGISKACFLEEEAPRLETWLNKNMHGEMSYMQNYFDKRLDPTLLVENAKSVISLAYNYYPEKQQEKGIPKISKYAYGNDYHEVIKNILFQFQFRIEEKIGQINSRVFVDSAPVLEKAWAKKSGLGWIGKNANLITKQHGSFFFLAEIILDVELNYDNAIKDYCGTCTKCIDACPTEAIVAPQIVDGSKCISYFTIELKNEIDVKMKGKFDNWIFGCDVCQDVCPWNRFSKLSKEKQFTIKDEIKSYTKNEWTEMNELAFNTTFKHSPIKRSKFKGFMRNVKFVTEK